MDPYGVVGRTWTGSCCEPDESNPHPVSLGSIYPSLRQGSPKGQSAFSAKICIHFTSPHMYHAYLTSSALIVH
jgi:hypothetical protein